MLNFKEKEIERRNSEQRLGVGLVTLNSPNSIVSEQFRTIRTNIQFAIEKKKYRSVMFTSSGAWEGKSTIAANVATTMANLDGLRVLLVDADMRKPTVHKTFDIRTTMGLSSLLTDRNLNFMDVAKFIPEANLYVIPSGPTPPNPAELLSSERMKQLIDEMATVFDLIMIDTPPILVVTDAQIVASRVDGVIFVLREGVAKTEDIIKSKQLLDNVDADVMGAIYNGAEGEAMDSYYGYGYGENIDFSEE